MVLGTLCVIIGILLYILISTRLTGMLVQGAHGDSVAYALLPLSYPCILVVFILLEAILFIRYIPSEEDYQKSRPFSAKPVAGEKKNMPTKKKLNILTAALAVAVLLCTVVSANTYTVVSEDGITPHFFVDTAHYGWDRVSSYKVDCDSSKGLSVTFTMDDGNSFEVLQNPTSSTASFTEKYDTPLAMLVDIDAYLRERSIPNNAAHIETARAFYEDEFPSLWKYVKVLTGYVDIYPEGDELPLETAD